MYNFRVDYIFMWLKRLLCTRDLLSFVGYVDNSKQYNSLFTQGCLGEVLDGKGYRKPSGMPREACRDITLHSIIY